MAQYAGFASMDALIDATVPTDIRRDGLMDMGEWTEPHSETEYLAMFKEMAMKNKVFKSYQGTGYHGTHVPQVIQRNVLENPVGWCRLTL
jgi:glycine dehydrogenase